MLPALVAIARRQNGVFSRQQARAAGYSPGQIDRLLAARHWFKAAVGVYRLAGAPVTWHSRAWVGILAAGRPCALSHAVAGRIHRIDGVPAYDKFDITVPANRRPRSVPGAQIHRAPLVSRDITSVGGLPVTTPTRTVVDVARVTPVRVGARVIADALRTGLVSQRRLDEALGQIRGRVGATQAKRATDLADPRHETMLEYELDALLAPLPLPERVPQFVVVHRGVFVARLDFAIPTLRLGVESDGYGVHSLRHQLERDRERAALLATAGWTLLSFSAVQIREQSAWLQQTVLEVAARLAA